MKQKIMIVCLFFGIYVNGQESDCSRYIPESLALSYVDPDNHIEIIHNTRVPAISCYWEPRKSIDFYFDKEGFVLKVVTHDFSQENLIREQYDVALQQIYSNRLNEWIPISEEKKQKFLFDMKKSIRLLQKE